MVMNIVVQIAEERIKSTEEDTLDEAPSRIKRKKYINQFNIEEHQYCKDSVRLFLNKNLLSFQSKYIYVIIHNY